MAVEVGLGVRVGRSVAVLGGVFEGVSVAVAVLVGVWLGVEVSVGEIGRAHV